MCDPEGLLPCEHQAVVLIEPIAGSGLSLTYSTEWADARLDRPRWNADALGLGGWSVDVLQRYDPEHGILLSGDGSWRIAAAADIGGGQRAVPTYDGLAYFVFDAEWRHVRTVDSATGITVLTFTYDETGRLLEVRGQTAAGPVHLTVERGANGALGGLLALGERRTGAALDSEGRLSGIGRPDGTVLSVEYSDFGLVSIWRATGRGASVFEYDAAGRLVLETDADGVTSEFAFEASPDAVTLTTTNAYGGTATMHVERVAEQLERTFTAADGTVTRLATNGDGSTTYAEPDGTVTTTGSIPHPTWGQAAPILSPLVETRPDGTTYRKETTTTMGGGSPEPAGHAWRTETVINGGTYIDQYDPATRTVRSVDPASRTTFQVYDEVGRLVEEQAAGQPRVAYGYDEQGRISSIAIGEDGAETVTTFSYEGGEVIARQPVGASLRLRHDQMGNLIGAALDGESISLLLDNTGAPLQLRPGNHPATSVGYSDAGRPTAFIPPVTDGDLSYEVTTYTPAGDVARIEGPGDRRIEMTYDAAGRATTWEYDRGTASATYAADSGLLTSLSSPDGVSTSFLYDGWVPVGLAWSGPVSGEVRRTVDSLLQPTAETVNGASSLTFGYDESGLLTSIGELALARDPTVGHIVGVSLGEVGVAYEYDDNARLVGLVATTAASEVLRVGYARDALGRVVGVQRTTAAGAQSWAFSYDLTGRLTSAERDGTSTTYEYDASGNRESGKARYDDRDRLLAWADDTFTYAPDGTLLERRGVAGTTVYDFDDLGNLRAVVLPDGGRVDYLLDASGRRMGRMRDGTLTEGYLYDVEDRIVAWTDGSGQVVARFGYDDLGRLALVARDGRELVVVTDQLGSPIALLDAATGELVAEMTYDAWGNLLADSRPGLIPHGFAGGLLDRDTGMVHFGARDYDPSTGRWTAPDPLRYGGGDLNLYRYAFGDPVNLVDPTGTTPCSVGACAGNADRAVPSPDYAGGKRGGGVGGGRSVGRGPQTPKGALTCTSGICRPSDPKQPYRPPSSLDCSFGVFCLPSNASKYPPGATGADRQVKQPSPPPNIFGEPHVLTLDGTHYDFQAAGEFVVAQSPDGQVRIQARFETPGSLTTVTRTTGLAVSVNGDRVAFYANSERPLVINGEAIERAEYAQTLPGGGVIERHGTEATVRWPDGTTLFAHVYARFINFGLQPSDAIARSLVGLVGGRDGDSANDLQTRDGIIMDPADPGFVDRVYGQFADSWRITDGESLFDYLPGETTETFQRRDIPTEPGTLDSLDEATRMNAEALCRAAGVTDDPILSDCVLDFGLTADATYVASAITVVSALERAAASGIHLGTAIELGQDVSDQLGAGQTDRYHFSVQTGDIVYIDAAEACDPALDWRLSRPDGRLIAFAEACTDLGRRVLGAAGEWLIDVYSDDSAAGTYSFRVIAVPQPQERPIAPGESASGSTTAVGEWHRYTLTTAAGQVVYLDAEVDCSESALWWRLLRPDGVLSTFGRVCTDMGRRVLDVAGDWTIEVYADDLGTGAYSFRVIDAPAARETTIAVGQTVTDATTRVGEWHRYTLTAAAGDVVFLDALGECAPGLFWRLLNPDGILRTFATACNDMGRQVLSEAGDWTIEVYADDLSTGAYSFRVLSVPPVTARTISLGQAATGTIAEVGEWHRYRLSTEAGQRIVIDMQGDCVPDLWWRLLRPDGVLSTFASTCADSDPRALDVAGDWVIEIYSDVMATGAYSFVVSASP